MDTPTTAWENFRDLNARRRAIRDFDGEPVADEDVRAVIGEALLAPSSGNLQPYQIHWVRDPAAKAALAAACEGQRAATSAAALLVVVADPRAGLRSIDGQRAHHDEDAALDARSREWHRREERKFRRFLRVAPWLLWAPLKALLTLLVPALTLIPVGPSGLRHWAARSSLYAAQTLLLAATARGLDACPMEGFNPREVARLLGLPRGAVVPVVIALGRRRADARVESRWRRGFDDAVVVH